MRGNLGEICSFPGRAEQDCCRNERSAQVAGWCWELAGGSLRTALVCLAGLTGRTPSVSGEGPRATLSACFLSLGEKMGGKLAS